MQISVKIEDSVLTSALGKASTLSQRVRLVDTARTIHVGVGKDAAAAAKAVVHRVGGAAFIAGTLYVGISVRIGVMSASLTRGEPL